MSWWISCIGSESRRRRKRSTRRWPRATGWRGGGRPTRKGTASSAGPIKFRFSVDGREIGGFDVKVLELRPAERVLWQIVDGPAEWIGTKVSFELKQEGDYSIVLFKHADWKEPVEFMNHCSTKWAVFLMSLKALVETGKGTPNPADPQISNWH